MKPCRVRDCGTLILADVLVCQEDWLRLPLWARDDLLTLRRMEPDSELCRRTEAVVLDHLNDTVTRVQQVAG